MKKSLCALLLTLAVLWIPAAVAQESIQEIQKALIEKWDSHNSLSAAFTVNAQVQVSPDMPMPIPISGTGALDYLKKDGKALHRINGWAGLSDQVKLAEIFSAFDGTKGHANTMFFGQNQTDDYGPADVIEPSGKAIFDQLAQHMTLAAAAGKKVGDKDCYVLMGALKEPVDQGVSLTKLAMCFDKTTGVPMQIGLIDKQNVEFGTITMTDIKIDPALSVEKFTPPAAPAPAVSAPTVPAPAVPAPAVAATTTTPAK